jgi:hypothetical protein
VNSNQSGFNGKGDMQMNDSFPNSQPETQSHLENAEYYKKSGFNAQAQHELELARQLNPQIVFEPHYKALSTDVIPQLKDNYELKIPLRIGAGILFTDVLLGIIILVVRLVSSGLTNLEFDDFVPPIIDIILGVNLWQLNAGSQRRTIWWAAIGLVILGGQALLSGDYFSLIIQTAFDGSLLLLLAGKPSKARTTVAVAVFAVGYLGVICLGLAALILVTLAGAA